MEDTLFCFDGHSSTGTGGESNKGATSVYIV